MKSTHFASLYPDTTRFAEIEKIISFVKEGNASQVIGLPGAGKSNILNLLAYNRSVRIKHLGEKQKLFHFVLVNFSEVKQKPLMDVIKFLFLELIDSLRDRSMREEQAVVLQLFKEYLLFHDQLVLFQGLKKAIDYLSGERHYTIVFLFDRFESYLSSVTAEFFSNLRVLRNRAKYAFSVVFSLNRPLEDTIEPQLLADFYEFFADHLIYIPFYDKPGFTFRLAYLEQATGKTITKKHLDAILSLTGGHGKLTRICIEYFLSQDLPEVQQTTLLSQKTVQGVLWELWYFLSPKEQKIVTTAIHTDKPITNELFLDHIGLIKEGILAIPLFEAFIKTTIPPTQDKQVAIIFHRENNTITKGEIVLSEKLTISEFRLLRYLLENLDTIVDRETIISAVWKENQTISGVSDQALDQLIFRLRKKIEEDPNNPQYIQTVKGRGIKFVQ